VSGSFPSPSGTPATVPEASSDIPNQTSLPGVQPAPEQHPTQRPAASRSAGGKQRRSPDRAALLGELAWYEQAWSRGPARVGFPSLHLADLSDKGLAGMAADVKRRGGMDAVLAQLERLTALPQMPSGWMPTGPWVLGDKGWDQVAAGAYSQGQGRAGPAQGRGREPPPPARAARHVESTDEICARLSPAGRERVAAEGAARGKIAADTLARKLLREEREREGVEREAAALRAQMGSEVREMRPVAGEGA